MILHSSDLIENRSWKLLIPRLNEDYNPPQAVIIKRINIFLLYIILLRVVSRVISRAANK